MAAGPTNNAPMSRKSQVSHLPGAKIGDKVSDGRDYNVEFDDALMAQEGWRNPRDKGCKVSGLFQNKFSEPGTDYPYGPPIHQHLHHTAPFSQSWEGDVINDQNPVVESHTTTIFYGDTIAGYKEDRRYPNVGPGFSYVFITKAYTFNPHTNDFFITEMLDPEDEVFERVVKQDLRYGDKFSLRLISEGVEHDLQDEYMVHWNKGLFSLIATYESCSEFPYSHPQQLVSAYISPEKEHYYYGLSNSPLSESAQNQIYTVFSYNTNPISQSVITGSFIIERNPDTWWWRRPQTSSFFDVTYNTGHARMAPGNSASGELDLHMLSQRNQGTGSIYTFMNRLMSLDHKYDNLPGKYYEAQQENFGTPPARKDLHIITFNGAAGAVQELQTELQYDGGIPGYLAGNLDLQNTTMALRHFGSVSISPGSLIGVPNINRGMTNHATSNTNPSTIGQSFNPNWFYTTTGAPAFDDYVVESNHWSSAGSNTFTYYTWFANNAIENTNDIYANRIWRPSYNITGSGVLKKAPHLDSWTISKLEKRKNVIMTNINKQLQLFEGTGNSGFVIIPENLHPTIKSNMDYYLRKAHLKDRGPRRKNVFSHRPRFIRRIRKRKPHFLNPFKFLRKKFKRFRWL